MWRVARTERKERTPSSNDENEAKMEEKKELEEEGGKIEEK